MKERWAIPLILVFFVLGESARAQNLPIEVLDHCRTANLEIATLASDEFDAQSETLFEKIQAISVQSGQWVLDHPEFRAPYFALRVGTGLLVRKKIAAAMYRKVGETLSHSIATKVPEILKWADIAPRSVSLSALEIQTQLETRLAQIFAKTESKIIRDEIAIQIESNLAKVFGAAEMEALGTEAGALARSMSKEFKKIPRLKTGTLSEEILKDTAKVARKGVWKMRMATTFTYMSGAILLEAIVHLFSSARSNPEVEWIALVDHFPDALLNPEIMVNAGITMPSDDPLQVHCFTAFRQKERMDEVISRIPRRLNYLFQQELKSLESNEL